MGRERERGGGLVTARRAVCGVAAIVAAACAVAACGSDTTTAGGGGGGGGGGGASADSRQLCVDEINRYRATNGKPPYARWSAEESCADTQAQSDGRSSSPHGAFGTCHEFGQDECPGWPGPIDTMIKDCLKAMWDEGPGGGHHDIMNSDDYTQVACGFATMSDGTIWSVQDFK